MMSGPPSLVPHPERDDDWDSVSPLQWARLWEAVRPGAPHAVDSAALGEYAILLHRRGAPAARKAIPDVAAHLAAGCASCEADLADLLAFAAQEERAAPTAGQGLLAGAGAGVLRQIIATRLTPQGGALAAGLRGAPGRSQDAPPYTFRTEHHSIVIDWEQRTQRGTVSVNGLVMPLLADAPSLLDGEARLLPLAAAEDPGAHPSPSRSLRSLDLGGGPGGGAHTERIDELGNFVYERVTPGDYRLELRSADVVVIVEHLRIGRPPSEQE